MSWKLNLLYLSPFWYLGEMSGRQVIPVDKNWCFRQADDEALGFLPVAQFPTNVHLDLAHNKIIPNPFLGKNENDVQWVGEKAWIYRTTFPSPYLNDKKTVLAFDGLDTYATVWLNGEEILKTENMFVPERVDVTKVLKQEGENDLEIIFESAFLIGRRIVEKHPDHHWACSNGDVSRLAVRKAQYHYGWDWGPALLTCGPWRPIWLELYNSRISDLYFTTEVDRSLQSAEIVAKADIEGGAEELRFEVLFRGEVIIYQTAKVIKGLATASFMMPNPELWFPAGYGKQPLYVLRGALVSQGREYDSVSKRFGFRRAELVQRRLSDAPGSTFLFEINNTPVFCGGSNWIPTDSFIPRISPQRYHEWVKLAVDGNQVMVRVWGGGIYEEESFYDACDESGVLVWQDFLFACGNYPAHSDFLVSVEREATANVKLLRHHPSIVIWAGNNEDYQIREDLKLDYDPEEINPQKWLLSNFPARYIYEKLLVEVTKALVPGTCYQFGSPFGGSDTRDPTIGDIHQWNVWHGTQEKYQNFDLLTGRFVSEFGMEGFPSLKTIDSYLPKGRDDEDRYPQSSTVDFHNKANGHERRIALYLVENIRYKFEPFQQFIYCTQLVQAECLASAYRLWRRQWKGPGREYCAGALVWQMNDCWPVTSWAIVDYYLRPKLAYYTIKRELSPVTVGLKRQVQPTRLDKDTRACAKKVHKLELWASNLSLESHTVAVHLAAWDITTSEVIYSKNLHSSFTLPSNRSTEISELPLPVSREGPDSHLSTVVAVYLLDQKGQQITRCVNWPEPLKYVHFQPPKQLSVKLLPGGRETVEISSDVPVKGVALECSRSCRSDDGAVVWEDNCIDLVPGETVRVGVRGLVYGDEGKIGVRYLGL